MSFYRTPFTALNSEREGRPLDAVTIAKPERGHFAHDSQVTANGTRRYAYRVAAANSLNAEYRDDFLAPCHFYGSGRHYTAILWWPRAADAARLSPMTATGTYHFGDYTLRPTGETDLARAEAWTKADKFHAKTTRADFWTEQTMSRDSYILEDLEGPVFFFKLHRLSINAVEVHCQFPPTDTTETAEAIEYEVKRVRAAILKGFEWLENALNLSRITTVYFDSSHAPLRNFAIRRLGFTGMEGTERLAKQIGGQ